MIGKWGVTNESLNRAVRMDALQKAAELANRERETMIVYTQVTDGIQTCYVRPVEGMRPPWSVVYAIVHPE